MGAESRKPFRPMGERVESADVTGLQFCPTRAASARRDRKGDSCRGGGGRGGARKGCSGGGSGAPVCKFAVCKSSRRPFATAAETAAERERSRRSRRFWRRTRLFMGNSSSILGKYTSRNLNRAANSNHSSYTIRNPSQESNKQDSNDLLRGNDATKS